MVPVAAGWLVLSTALGRAQEQRANRAVVMGDAAAVQGERA
jgi:hypothetical protein